MDEPDPRGIQGLPGIRETAYPVQCLAFDLVNDLLEMTEHEYVLIGEVAGVKAVMLEGVEYDPFNRLPYSAGSHGHGFCLMTYGVNGPGKIVDGFTETGGKGGKHVGGRAPDAEIQLKI